jgi:hypothetical protein
MINHIFVSGKLLVKAVVLKNYPERCTGFILFLKYVETIYAYSPDVSLRTVASILMVVDLPAPLGPRKPTKLFFSIFNDRESTATKS